MGSPQNYYGVGTYLYNRSTRTTTTTTTTRASIPKAPSSRGAWTNPSNAATAEQRLHDRRLPTTPPSSGTRSVCRPEPAASRTTRRSSSTAWRCSLNNVYISGSGTSTNCYRQGRGQLERRHNLVDGPEHERAEHDHHHVKTVGSNSATASPGAATAGRTATSRNSNFRVRLTWLNGAGNASCASIAHASTSTS